MGRAQAYLAAGADGIYPIGLDDRATLRASGDFAALASNFTYADVQQLFVPR